MGVNSRSLHDIADEIANRLNSSTGGAHDVSNEPRVPKGSGDQSGEWTRGGASAPGSASSNSSASGHGKKVTIVHADNSVETRAGGSAAWRNNNPGNIKAGPGAARLGAIGSDGRFAIFPDDATGTAAQEALLLGLYGGKTLDETIAGWAPPEDGNDTARYQALVRHWTGLSGNQKIGDLTPDDRHKVMAAQRRMELWQPGTVSRTSAQ